MKDIAIFGALSDDKFNSKIEPLIDLDIVRHVHLYRYAGNSLDSEYDNKIIFYKSSRNKYLCYLKTIFSLFRLSYFRRINILIGIYFYPFGMIVGLIGLITNIPYILILPGSDLRKLMDNKLFHFLLRKSYRIGVRGNNSLIKVRSLGIPEERLFILHNSFDLPTSYETKKNDRIWDIIFIGYFRKPKRLDISLEVIEKLVYEFSDLKCVFLGDGSEYEFIQKLIFEKNLENNVFLKGHVKNVGSYLRESKIFLLTSESEGLPMVLVEAMSYGVPVVSSDINDISDVVKHNENGFLVKSLEADDYVKYLRILLKDEKKYENFKLNSKLDMKSFHNNQGSFGAIKNIWSKIILT